MLLLHQIGSVKIGDVVRYTVTYTPAHDRILPAPEHLYLRIRNTCSSALRAAFVHGPYTLYVDAYPAHFDPNRKLEQPRQYGVPEFEPMLKAGGTWSCRLLIPESVRLDAGNGGGRGSGEYQRPPSVSWIINVSSQVIFSTSSAVHYEVLLARDAKSLETGGGITAGIPLLGGGDSSSSSNKSTGQGGQFLQPGKVSDYQRGRDGRHPDQPKGVFSRAIQLRVEDTGALWNKPQLPGWDTPPSTLRVAKTVGKKAVSVVELPTGGSGSTLGAEQAGQEQQQQQQQRQRNHEEQQLEQQRALENGAVAESQARQQARTTIPAPKPGRAPKKVHLVVLTHGLHSNLGSDMLYIKESIDLAVQQAKIDRRARRAKERSERGGSEKEENDDDMSDSDDDEEVIVRGYSGNATKTERGIKYLGKRLARYVLSTTYPDQPFLPSSKAGTDKAAAAAAAATVALKSQETAATDDVPRLLLRKGSIATETHRQYRFTKISFIAHSLGGPVQMYAVAYIQKHSPQFFDLIQPVHFIAMASPFLGLNHENPMYVKFALDFGLVGRTGQDLGLTWRAPTLARSGWGALMGNLGENAHKKVMGEAQPESKPLLRILPTGPAHIALKKFRNRTVYSNVVNDGIVPLRTSCLLFLDWQGLGRVEKARREAGLVETVVGFGWSELVGNNVTTPRGDKWEFEEEEEAKEEKAEADAEDGKKRDDGTHGVAVTAGTASTPANPHDVPQPPTDATKEDVHDPPAVPVTSHFRHAESPLPSPTTTGHSDAAKMSTATTNNTNPISSFFTSFFKGGGNGDEGASASASAGAAHGADSPDSPTSPTHHSHSHNHSQHAHKPSSSSHSPTPSSKRNRIYQRSQTLRPDDFAAAAAAAAADQEQPAKEASKTASKKDMASAAAVTAPPKTSFFESATDIINPKLPPVEFLIDPAKRPRAIFHDRIYHPSDIPAVPTKRRPGGSSSSSAPLRRLSFQQRAAKAASSPTSSHHTERGGSIEARDSNLSMLDYDDPANTGSADRGPDDIVDTASMRVEEKIARAYHRGLSWRKVLVKLEPDAHNNMIVRRMFANAFGWPVVKHMVDAHFSDAAAVQMRDDERKRAAAVASRAEASKAAGPSPAERGRTRSREEEKEAAPGGGGGGGGDSSVPTLFLHEAESEDRATDLPTSSSATPASTAPARPPLAVRPKSSGGGHGSERGDSVTWSDGDWNDSGDDSDGPVGSSSRGHDDDKDKGKRAAQQQPSSSSSTKPTGVSVTATTGTTAGPLSPLANLLSGSFGSGGGSGSSSASRPTSSSTGGPTSPTAWNWKDKIVGKQPARAAARTPEPSQPSPKGKSA